MKKLIIITAVIFLGGLVFNIQAESLLIQNLVGSGEINIFQTYTSWEDIETRGFSLDKHQAEIPLLQASSYSNFQTNINFPAITVGAYEFYFSTIQSNRYLVSKPISLQGDLSEYLSWKYYDVGDWDKFKHMVQTWIQLHPEFLAEIGIRNLNEIMPNQAALLAAEIVMDKLEYDDFTRPSSRYIEEILEEGKGVCNEYGLAVSAVFDLLKNLYPKNLKNSYMQMIFMGLIGEAMHGYNALFNILENGKAVISLIDATWADIGYNILDYTNSRLPDFIRSLFQEGLIEQEQALNSLEDFLKIHSDHIRAVGNKLNIKMFFMSRLDSIPSLMEIVNNSFSGTNYANYAALTLRTRISNYIQMNEFRSGGSVALRHIAGKKRRLKEMIDITDNLFLFGSSRNNIRAFLRDIEQNIEDEFASSVNYIINGIANRYIGFPRDLADKINEIFISNYGLDQELVFRHFAQGIVEYIEKGGSPEKSLELIEGEINRLVSYLDNVGYIREEFFLNIVEEVRNNVVSRHSMDIHHLAPEWVVMDEKRMIERLAWDIMEERGLPMSTKGHISQVQRIWEMINVLTPELGELLLKWIESPNNWQSWADVRGIKTNDDGTINILVETGSSNHPVLRLKTLFNQISVIEDIEIIPTTDDYYYYQYAGAITNLRITPENLFKFMHLIYFGRVIQLKD